ncbi:hypothetical protein HYW99_03940 [Candidatus Woesearchaeota archaeon]|nr:hypothetical protein [Candidatus Woesearchaeota archaeon]
MILPRTDYYEGILQLRNVNADILDFLYNKIKARKDIAIIKEVKFCNGLDLYITSQKYTRTLGKLLKESFGGELKVSSKLHTRSKEGKRLYRINVLFRAVRFKVGDIISVRGNKLRVTRISEKIFAKDINTGRKIALKYEEIQ